MIVFLSAWREHHETSRRAAQLLDKHVRAFGWSGQEAAHRMQVTASQYSRSLSGVEGLNFWKALLLPDRIVIGWLDDVLALYTAQVLEDVQFYRMVALFNALVRRQKATMLKAQPDAAERKRA